MKNLPMKSEKNELKYVDEMERFSLTEHLPNLKIPVYHRFHYYIST